MELEHEQSIIERRNIQYVKNQQKWSTKPRGPTGMAEEISQPGHLFYVLETSVPFECTYIRNKSNKDDLKLAVRADSGIKYMCNALTYGKNSGNDLLANYFVKELSKPCVEPEYNQGELIHI
ncbi:hypothetical protein WA026_020437, partial [Henosepilachna vigintioctopunctata]